MFTLAAVVYMYIKLKKAEPSTSTRRPQAGAVSSEQQAVSQLLAPNTCSYPDRANHSDLARLTGSGVELHISDTAGGNPTQQLALDTTDGSTAVCMLMVERQKTPTTAWVI
jgi:hypothetical protein